MSRYCCKVISILAAALLPMIVQANSFQDPLDAPAVFTDRAESSLMLSAAQAGSRLVAVGEFGRIIVSDDEGHTWRQVKSPVSVDLVSVWFSSDTTGWATGHSGVVLKSIDGGLTWNKLIDGRQVETLMRDHYQQRLNAGNESAAHFLRDVDLNFQNGPELPFLDVWFGNDNQGFVVGAFGMILATQDGGKTWIPWMDRIENPDVLHLNAVGSAGEHVFIVGERGVVWKLDPETQQFVAHQSGYTGSFFGVTGNEENVVVFGLRGNAYRSRDDGSSWQPLSLPTRASINDGVVLPDGTLVLVTQSGQVVVGAVEESEFVASRVNRPTLLAGVVPVDSNAVVVAGLNGVQREMLSFDTHQTNTHADEDKR